MNINTYFLLDTIVLLIMCHMIGDFVLQIDFIAAYKRKSLYGLFIHSMLYCFPFYYFFGLDLNLVIVFISHMIIDKFALTKNKNGMALDQFLHYLVLIIYLVTFGVGEVAII